MSQPQKKPLRSIRYHFRVNDEEDTLIRERMERMGVTSVGAYMRKMAIDGYFVNIDLSDIRELVSLLRRCSNNLNQYAKRANETGSIYKADIEDLRSRLDGIWNRTGDILTGLSRIK